MSDKIKLKIRGKCRWASIIKPKPGYMNKPPEFSIDVSVTDKDLTMLTKAGMKIGDGQFDTKVKVDDDGTKFLTFKQPTKAADGSDLFPIKVVGPQRQEFTEAVGNGSDVVVHIVAFKPKNFPRTAFRLQAVQVLKHVPFVAGLSDDDFDYIEPEVTDEDSSDVDDFLK